jgi:8-oxo-dGTP diphosphatase
VKKPIKIAPKAIIFDQNKVLILTRSKKERKDRHSHGWDFPGGSLEPGEQIMDALAREVKEETGLTIKVISPAYIYDEIMDEKHLVIMKFACCNPVGQIELSAEHEDYRWVEMKKLADEPFPEWMKEEMKRAYRMYQAYREEEHNILVER